LRSLIVIAVVAAGARMLIKDPPPPKQVDRSQFKVRYVPGMLENLPKSALDKMDPKLLADIRKAEMEARMAQDFNPTMYAKGAYKPSNVPLENQSALETQKQYAYSNARRNAKIRMTEPEEPVDTRRTTLVQFTSGGAIKAEKASAGRAGVDMDFGKTMQARVPQKMVARITPNSLEWKEPIPRGFVELKPARGITITVAKETARRITVSKPVYDEI
jgi:hypothetical protein